MAEHARSGLRVLLDEIAIPSQRLNVMPLAATGNAWAQAKHFVAIARPRRRGVALRTHDLHAQDLGATATALAKHAKAGARMLRHTASIHQ